jgi:type 1 fimbriae regulatory protein FimB/type 1 fimbriae regulatory protein FimE
MPHAVPPRKAPNATRRSREYLTPREVDALIAAARRLGRHGHRDATMLLLAYRHGLRVSELVALRWEQVDLQSGVLHVRRRKNGLATTHPLYGPEIRALRALVSLSELLDTVSELFVTCLWGGRAHRARSKNHSVFTCP